MRAVKARARRSVLEALEGRTLLSAWGTVDDYQLAAGLNANSHTLTADGVGNVYAAGSAWDSTGHSHAIVRQKAAGGSTWTTIEDYTVPSPGAAHGGAWFYSAAVDGAGDLYVAGQTTDSSGKLQWLVMEKPASSSTFSIVDNYSTNGGGMAEALAVDASGNVFAAGQSAVTSTKGKSTTTYSWTVRKQTGGHGAFATVDNVVSSTTYLPNAWDMAAINSGPSAGIYVVGTGTSGNWLVRKSADAGATWASVDNFTYSPSGNSYAFGVTGDAAGNVVVAGRGSDGVSTHWLVRQSRDGGASWSTADNFLGGGASNQASDIGTDLAGKLYAVGYGQDSAGGYHQIVRSNAGGTWATVSDLPTNGSGTSGFTADSTGTLYVVSGIRDSGGISHWVTQTAAGPTAPSVSAATATTAASVFSATQIAGNDDVNEILSQRKHRHG